MRGIERFRTTLGRASQHPRRGHGAVRARERRPTDQRVGVLVEPRYRAQAQPAGLITALRSHGHDVLTIDPDAALTEVHDDRWLWDVDVVVARGRSHALFCLLAWAESRGVATINRRAAVAAVHDKAAMAVVLAGAGVPMPKTFLGPAGDLASRIPRTAYPVILKPAFGDNCRGLRIVDTPGELMTLEWPEPLMLAQEFLPGDGRDLKLYVIGRRVWAVRKPSPLGSHDEPSEPVECTSAMHSLACRCGELFGLDLYGVDCLETPAGAVVLEVNEFPNYTGVPDAGDRLAEHVRAQAKRERRP